MTNLAGDNRTVPGGIGSEVISNTKQLEQLRWSANFATAAILNMIFTRKKAIQVHACTRISYYSIRDDKALSGDGVPQNPRSWIEGTAVLMEDLGFNTSTIISNTFLIMTLNKRFLNRMIMAISIKMASLQSTCHSLPQIHHASVL